MKPRYVEDLNDVAEQDRLPSVEMRGRAVTVTTPSHVEGVYDVYVDGKRFDSHLPTDEHGELRSGLTREQMRSEDSVAGMLRVVRAWLTNEDRLRQAFPLGATVHSEPRSRFPDKVFTGIVVGHRHRVVQVQITRTTYLDPTAQRSKVGEVVEVLAKELKEPELYPEHERLRQLREESRTVTEFLEWLLGGQTPYTVAQYNPDTDQLFPADVHPATLFAQWQEIDLGKLDQEREEMLARLRAIRPEV